MTQAMFEVGQHILYGTSGVCEVQEIVRSPFDKNDLRLYYVLKPLFATGNSTIYTLVDNAVITMRRLMSYEEAEAFMARASGLVSLPIEDERKRHNTYKETIMRHIPDEFFGLIKSVKERRLVCARSHKRLPEVDGEYEGIAKRSLFGELSVILGVPFEEMETYFTARAGLADSE